MVCMKSTSYVRLHICIQFCIRRSVTGVTDFSASSADRVLAFILRLSAVFGHGCWIWNGGIHQNGLTRVDHGELHWCSLIQSDAHHHKRLLTLCVAPKEDSDIRLWVCMRARVFVMRCICVVIETDGYELCKPLALHSTQHSRIQYLKWWMLDSPLLSALETRACWWPDIPYIEVL